MGHIAPVNSVDFANGNSDYLVTSGRDRAVKIWHWKSKTVKLTVDLRKHGRGAGLLYSNFRIVHDIYLAKTYVLHIGLKFEKKCNLGMS